MSSLRTSVALLGLAVACGSDPPAESPAGKKPVDTTEVKMEAVPVASTAAPPSEPAPATSTATIAAPANTPAGDPSEDPNLGGPQEATLEKAVAPIRSRLRACYKKALVADAKAAGSATFDTTIGKDGKVGAARFVKKDGLSDDFVNCLTSAVKSMVFSPDRKSQVVSFTFGNTPATPGAVAKPPPVTAPAASYGGPDAGPSKH